ncbi:serine protease snk-like isoform X2 [Diabrotica undecimpunctata]
MEDICNQTKNFEQIVCCLDDPIYLPQVISAPLEKDNINKRIGPRPGDIANKMCKVYSRYAYEETLMTAFGESHQYLDCEIYNNELIVTPQFSKLKEFPHMVQIGYGLSSNIKWGCAGSLISENYILTATKCIRNPLHGDAKFVRAGDFRVEQTEQNGFYLQIREIAETIFPSNLYFSENQSLVLLKVKTNFKLNGYIRPACLYTNNDISQGKLITAGWKLTEYGEKENQQLNRVYVQPLPEDKCSDNDIAGIKENNSICTKADTNGHYGNICTVDVGGPLLQFHPIYTDVKCMHDIVGVKLDDTECKNGESGINIYAKVYNYIKWIEDTAWQNVTI